MHKPLSSVEIEKLAMMIYTSELVDVVQYVNRIIYDRNLGIDGCSRPLASRSKEDENETCFAVGYLNIVKSFIEETAVRMKDEGSKKLKDESSEFIVKIVAEIKTFLQDVEDKQASVKRKDT